MNYLFLSWAFVALISNFTICDYSKFSEIEIRELKNEVKSMFYHAYDGYIKFAMPYDELRPLTCDGHDTWGSYSLTLIDALDTLAVMGNASEFKRVYHLIAERKDFDADINVSVFETNIRIVGGLISAHLMARRMGLDVGDEWPCRGPLLRLAVDAAMRLLPAFDTPTGLPYGTVNLRSGVPEGETPVTCTAGVGTFIIEFGTISRLTGNPVFEQVALRAMHFVWGKRSRLGLIGNHIDVLTGAWTGVDAGIGAGVDSFFEYLVKGSFLLQRPELLSIFNKARTAIDDHLRHEDWYLWKSMNKGHISMAVFQSLEAFWPGVLTLVGDIESAQKTMFNYHHILKQYGFHPEFYNIPESAAYSKRSGYPLRPEFVESLVYLYQATRDHTFLRMGADLLKAIEHSAKTRCGYATISDVSDHSLDNRMESFFLAETTKYLYLLFDEKHWLHSSGGRGRPHKVGGRSCVIEGGVYIFNTEAHPIDSGSLGCCSGPEDKDIMSKEDLVNLLLYPDSDLDLKFESELNVIYPETYELVYPTHDMKPDLNQEDLQTDQSQVVEESSSNNYFNVDYDSQGSSSEDIRKDIDIGVDLPGSVYEKDDLGNDYSLDDFDLGNLDDDVGYSTSDMGHPGEVEEIDIAQLNLFKFDKQDVSVKWDVKQHVKKEETSEHPTIEKSNGKVSDSLSQTESISVMSESSSLPTNLEEEYLVTVKEQTNSPKNPADSNDVENYDVTNSRKSSIHHQAYSEQQLKNDEDKLTISSSNTSEKSHKETIGANKPDDFHIPDSDKHDNSRLTESGKLDDSNDFSKPSLKISGSGDVNKPTSDDTLNSNDHSEDISTINSRETSTLEVTSRNTIEGYSPKSESQMGEISPTDKGVGESLDINSNDQKPQRGVSDILKDLEVLVNLTKFLSNSEPDKTTKPLTSSQDKIIYNEPGRIVTKKDTKKIFMLDDFRSRVAWHLTQLEADTANTSYAVLSCPVTFAENFIYKGQMINTKN